MGEQKKKRFHMPHAYTLIFLLIVLVAVLTWIIPSGEFQRTMVETSTGEREVVVAGTYHGVSKIAEDGTNLRQGIQAVLTAPALGIQNAIEVLAFVFIIGGVFQIMAKTNALNMGIRSIIDKLGDKEFLMIPILMILFGLGGTTYGMSDELVPFYLLVMPVVFAMGYDSMTTFMIVCMSATVGYAASTINPFCVLVAQGIAGIQGNPQLVFRMIQWVIMMAIIIAFTTIRAMKVKKNPQSSITYKDDIIKRQEMITQEAGNTKLTVRQKLVLVVFVAGMALIITGLVKFGWYMNELSMVFLGMGLLMGIIGGLGETEIAEEFVAGVKDIAFAAILIGFCSGIMVVANDGKIIDTILNSLSNLLAGTGNVLFREMCMLMLKYPNVYTDTSVLYLDSPEESIYRLFCTDMGEHWSERAFAKQIMFASNTPRFRAFKIRRSIEKLPIKDSVKENILGKNAERFLGMVE